MADFTINLFLDDDKLKRIEDAGLADSVTTVDGKKAVQVPMSAKEKKKLAKGFPDMTFNENTCELPPEAADKLCDIVVESKTIDVMKMAIMKLYNPLAGKAPRSAQR